MSPGKRHWYWHRLRAMSPAEMALHLRKHWREYADACRARDWSSVKLESAGAFPRLPRGEAAPEMLRAALQRDTEPILAGRWKAFGHLELRVDDPPKWHCDYLAGKDLKTPRSAFDLNHRELPGGADIKLIWELSRWHPLVRLAMAAHVLGDERAAEKCLVWLEDWVKQNPPYTGWNWTSGLEAGLRLVQFTWIDALLAAQAEAWGFEAELETLRYEILPPHAWFAWRHQSFGSSANNHLIGELAGLILATVRWPALAQWGAPLEELQRRWEREILAQFAPDGGNREQALNYHWFSWEFCWQARLALAAAGRGFSPAVEQRLTAAARFYWEVQAAHEVWDYGDSDNAFVTPFFCRESTAVPEWRNWLGDLRGPSAIRYWLDAPPPFEPPLGRGEPTPRGTCGQIVTIRFAATLNRGEPALVWSAGDWWVYPDTGVAVCESGYWWLRWDLSPLGYLSTAAHGHLDALHLSLWYKGVALLIDPGTGAYYADETLRNWLASRAAHNGPAPAGVDYPKRWGSFLWAAHHAVPQIKRGEAGLSGVLVLPGRLLRRQVKGAPDGLSWQVEDQCVAKDGSAAAFSVRWQFAPECKVRRLGPRKFTVNRSNVSLVCEADPEWAEVRLVETEDERAGDAPLAGLVSSAFRQVRFAPYLLLTAPAATKPCVFRTTFLASPRS